LIQITSNIGNRENLVGWVIIMLFRIIADGQHMLDAIPRSRTCSLVYHIYYSLTVHFENHHNFVPRPLYSLYTDSILHFAGTLFDYSVYISLRTAH
jgi:hypothetical protein